VIFQLIDDHSRYAVASHVAPGETAEGAIAVVKKAIAAHGVPQRLLSDNGVALNPSRRGVVGQPIAATLEQLQEQVDRLDIIYNTERPHQGLPGRITPLQAWETTPKAEPPRPRGDLIRPVGWDGVRITRVARNGIVQVRSTRFHVTRLLAGQTVYLIETNEHLLVFNDRGTEIMQHRWPKPGTAYVSSGRPEDDTRKRSDVEVSPMS
jgi:putative transposase